MADEITQQLAQAIANSFYGMQAGELPTGDAQPTPSAGDMQLATDIVADFDVRPLATPPADDVREALIEALADGQNWIYNGTHTVFNEGCGADSILAVFDVRPRGTVTDAEVGRAVIAYRHARNGFGHMNSDVHARCMRAALEAAWEERNRGVR